MANQITGKVIAFSNAETIASTDPSRQPMTKRKLLLDCTRYDPFTGERDKYENTPLLEFSGNALEKLEALITAGLKKDDVVTISFDVKGFKYTSKSTGKQDVFTSIRPYNIELREKPQAPQQEQPPMPTPPQAQESLLPF